MGTTVDTELVVLLAAAAAKLDNRLLSGLNAVLSTDSWSLFVSGLSSCKAALLEVQKIFSSSDSCSPQWRPVFHHVYYKGIPGHTYVCSTVQQSHIIFSDLLKKNDLNDPRSIAQNYNNYKTDFS